VKLALVTDAWFPQVNGVVRTLSSVVKELETGGDEVMVISPDGFRTMPCPRYPEIRLSLWPWGVVPRRLKAFRPDHVHIATEGPLGLAARRFCGWRKIPFTTSYHTQFPQYLWSYVRMPVGLTYRAMRWFHGRALHTLVPTPNVKRELDARGFTNIVVWTRGVDTELFHPRDDDACDLPWLADTERPIFCYAGRVAIEKNIKAFLDADLPGTKLVIGAGPMLEAMKAKYPAVRFVGYKFGEELARHFACADVFVFPSRTDTFGVVMLEAMASGLPVAAYPVTGPIDVVKDGVSGILDEDIAVAARRCLELDPAEARRYAEGFTWANTARIFRDALAPIEWPGGVG